MEGERPPVERLAELERAVGELRRKRKGTGTGIAGRTLGVILFGAIVTSLLGGFALANVAL